MKKGFLLLVVLAVTLLLNTGCANKTINIAKGVDSNSITKNKKVSDTKSKSLVLKSEKTSEKKKNLVINKGENVSSLVSKIVGNKITSKQERKIYTSLSSLNKSYTVTIDGLKLTSMNRDKRYEAINRNTACTLFKDLTISDINTSINLNVCQTTDYKWIVR
jgi:hypothetical protein